MALFPMQGPKRLVCRNVRYILESMCSTTFYEEFDIMVTHCCTHRFLKPHDFADYSLERILCSLKLLHAAKWEQFWKKGTEEVERVDSFIHTF